MLPEVRALCRDFGMRRTPGLVGRAIPICGVAGDQQAALFGQCCFDPGQAKNTYGTGCFLLMNTGRRGRCASQHGLADHGGRLAPWRARAPVRARGQRVHGRCSRSSRLRDELGIIDSVAATDAIARSVAGTDGVFVVPAFTGLGAPWWDADARGAIRRPHPRRRARPYRAGGPGVDCLPGAATSPVPWPRTRSMPLRC